MCAISIWERVDLGLTLKEIEDGSAVFFLSFPAFSKKVR